MQIISIVDIYSVFHLDDRDPAESVFNILVRCTCKPSIQNFYKYFRCAAPLFLRKTGS
jgi:hypothetical protein